MTTPQERILAMKFAADFMRKVRDLPDAPSLLREEAKAILRHYPTGTEVDLIASVLSGKLQPGNLHISQ